MSERIIEDPVFRTRYRFERVADAEGDALQVEMWVDPGGGVSPHVHPSMEERFEVLSGRPSFLAGRKWQEAAPGETVVVPPGTRHAFRNKGAEVAHVLCKARPPLELQGFLEDVAGLSRAGKLRQPGLPKGLGGLLAGAVLADHYRDTVILLLPPPIVQRTLMRPLVRLAERRGYKAGEFAQAA